MTNYKLSPAQARMIENVSEAQDRHGDTYACSTREERTARSLIKRGHLQVASDGETLRVALVVTDTPKTLLNVRNFPRRNQRKLAKRLARALRTEGAYKVEFGDRLKVVVAR